MLPIGGASVACPASQDLLAHLMVLALYGHRLDCGPLVLADIHFLLATREIDWGNFLGKAATQGWERGAALLLTLTARHFGPQPYFLPPRPMRFLRRRRTRCWPIPPPAITPRHWPILPPHALPRPWRKRSGGG